jgi:hypothetical protein
LLLGKKVSDDYEDLHGRHLRQHLWRLVHSHHQPGISPVRLITQCREFHASDLSTLPEIIKFCQIQKLLLFVNLLLYQTIYYFAIDLGIWKKKCCTFRYLDGYFENLIETIF